MISNNSNTSKSSNFVQDTKYNGVNKKNNEANEKFEENLSILKDIYLPEYNKAIHELFSSKMQELNHNLPGLVISKRDNPFLTHSYIILDTGDILIKVKKSNLKEHIAEGGVKNIYRQQDIKGNPTHVTGILMPTAKAYINQDIQGNTTDVEGMQKGSGHINLVKLNRFREIFKDEPNICVGHLISWKNKSHNIEYAFISPLMTSPDLMELSLMKSLPKNVIMEAMIQSAAAVKVIHDKGVVHHDIKLENFLASYTPLDPADPYKEGTLIVKLGDFDFSKQYDELSNIQTKCGTPGLIEPQFENEARVVGVDNAQKIDIYALGVSFYQLLHPNADFPLNLEINKKIESFSDWDYNDLDETEKKDEKLEGEKVINPDALPWDDAHQPSPEPEKDTMDHLIWKMTHPHRSQRCSIDYVIDQLNSLNAKRP